MLSLHLVPVNLQSVHLHRPLPYNLVDRRGVLLASKGFVFETEKLLKDLANHGGGFYVDLSNSADKALTEARKAYVNQLFTSLRKQDTLGNIASVNLNYSGGHSINDLRSPYIDWHDAVQACNTMLRKPNAEHFASQLEKTATDLMREVRTLPDDTLLALFYLAGSETQIYSATHSMLVAAVCAVTANEVLHWPECDVVVLIRAAIAMNLGMTELQDTLSRQTEPPTLLQRKSIAQHPVRSSELLNAMGVQDQLLLDIVRQHHTLIAQPLRSTKPSYRFAGLIQRVDLFTARLSPRVSRRASPNSVAMKSIYYDPAAQTDEAGAAILKAAGIYHPGAFVRLRSGEVAIVLRRGKSTTTPTVAAVVNRAGLPMVEPIVRNTAEPPFNIESQVHPAEVRIQLRLERLIKLNHGG